MIPVPIASGRLATLAALLLAVTPSLRAEERAAEGPPAAELLPASTVFYAEIENPKELIGLLLDHPLRERLEKSPDYRKALESPQFKEFRAVVAAIEKRSGVEWRKALEASTGGGLVVAFDATTQGAVLLSRSEDVKTTAKVRDALFSLAREDAAGKGKDDPIKTEEYRGLKSYQAGEAWVADVGPWLVASNKPALAKTVADRFLDAGQSDKPRKTLAADADFAKARSSGKSGDRPTAWAFLRLDPVRQMAAGKPPFDKTAKSDDPGVELLFGGLLGPLRNAPYVTASLSLDKQHVKLAVTSPNDRKWAGKEREFFFAPAGEGGGAARPLRPSGTLLSITTYRDLAAWWASAPDLLSEGAAAKMAQADSGVSVFLGGKSFGTDVLGAFKPQIQLVAASQDYKAAGVPAPKIQLPAFAIVFGLKEKEAADAKLVKHLRVTFQSLVALGNLDGSAKGRPMLTMQSEKRGKAEILSAVYEPDDDADGGKEKQKKPDAKADNKPDGKPAEKMMDAKLQDIHYNFSPALVMSKDHLILCSTRQIALELADLAEKQEPGGKAETIKDNTRIEIAPAPAAKLLRDNREQLVAQNMLEKGHDRAAAEKEIDLLVTLVSSVKDASLRLTPTDESIRIELDVTTVTPE